MAEALISRGCSGGGGGIELIAEVQSSGGKNMCLDVSGVDITKYYRLEFEIHVDAITSVTDTTYQNGCYISGNSMSNSGFSVGTFYCDGGDAFVEFTKLGEAHYAQKFGYSHSLIANKVERTTVANGVTSFYVGFYRNGSWQNIGTGSYVKLYGYKGK